MTKRLTLREWQELTRKRLARNIDPDDWSNLSVPEIIRREKARIRKEDATRRAREMILSAQVAEAERGFGPLTKQGIVQEMLDRAAAEQHRLNPHNRSRYDDLQDSYRPKKR
jgi:hypothetical protein